MITEITQKPTDAFSLLGISKEERGLVDETSNPYKRLLVEAKEKYDLTLAILTSLNDRIMREIRPKLDKELSAVKALELLNSMYEDEPTQVIHAAPPAKPANLLPPPKAMGGEKASLAFSLGERQRQFIEMIERKSLELNIPADRVEIHQKEFLKDGFNISAFYANNGRGYRRFVKRRKTGPETLYSLDEYGLNCYRGGKL
jgi:hypothetical protein